MNTIPFLRLASWVAWMGWMAQVSGSPLDAYNVVWDAPSRDHHGSMPLGNGDVAVNAWMMLEYVDHTGDRDFLRGTVLPFAREILVSFEQHYPTDARNQLVMHPSQALETWWHCTNAAPELAGCLAVTDRLLTLPEGWAGEGERADWRRFRAKLPPVPVRDVQGRTALAPASFFADKRNIENPELYPVFPFRLFAFNRPNSDWALAALEHRWDRGHSGWRQDCIASSASMRFRPTR